MYAEWMKRIDLSITIEDIREYEKRKKEIKYERAKKRML